MHKLDPLHMPLEGIRLIEASAGTGKTYTIASLYLRLMVEKVMSVRDVLVVTFTNAATEELRERIRDRLRQAIHLLHQGNNAIAQCEDEVMREVLQAIGQPREMIQHLLSQLTCIDEAAIYTIHGFSQRMLVDHAFESGALFETELLQNEEELLDEVCRDYWRQHYYPASSGLVQQVLQHWASPIDLKWAIRDYLKRPYQQLLPHIEAADYSEGRYFSLYAKLQALWQSDAATLQEVIRKAVEDKALSTDKKAFYNADKFAYATEALAQFFAETPQVYALPDDFVLYTQSHLDSAVTKTAAKNGKSAPQHEFFTLGDELQQLIEQLHSGLMAQALEWCRQELQQRKQAAALLSFDDLLEHLHHALHSEQGDELAQHIRTRFPYAMIDEFQDTDPLQFGIFQRIYAQHDDSAGGFYMIGDPKQAIYSFRGADIFTYMQAKQLTGDEHQYTLDTNWRSSSSLIEAVNQLFGQSPAPFIYAGHIDYHPVQPSPQADAEPLLIEGSVPAPLQCWFVPRTEARTTQKGIPRLKMDLLKPELAEASASQIARLLTLGRKQQAMIGEAPLVPNDIAVLVRDRHEAAQVRSALRDKGIGSAYYSRDSVFDSDEALQLLSLLQAINEPGHEGLLRAALSSRLIGMSASELDQLLENDLAWEERLAQVYRYHQLWQEQGFMPMFRSLLHEQGIPHRLLSLNDGERRLTNLLQVAELVQAASREHEGMENQLRWLNEQLDTPDGNQEDQRLRLESDENLVKVVNIHTSKGLEYPIVFLPYLWSNKPTKKGRPLYVHSTDAHKSLLLDLQPDAEQLALAEKERLAEDLRLLYVALTRAKHLCYFSYGYMNGLETSALGWLLHGRDANQPLQDLKQQLDKPEDTQLRKVLETIQQASSGHFQVTELPDMHTPLPRELPQQAQMTARNAERDVSWHWRMTSYSGLTATHGGSGAYGEFHQTGSTTEDASPADEVETAQALDLHHFPKGARAGTFMHTVLENIDFALNDEQALVDEVTRQMQRHDYDAKWQAAILQMVKQTLTTPLNEQGLTLQQIPAHSRLVEMEFQYPIRQLNATGLNRLLLGNEPAHTLEFNTVSGIMRGFIDLSFEHGGRYYIADYKSNWLGYRAEDYTPERLQQVILEHRYDLQYLLYTLALHRYLQANMAGYDYELHFGGVYYLFLRGMSPEHGSAHGVFHARPEFALVDELDRMMRGKA